MVGDHSDLPEILSHVDPASCDYQTWVSVGMALHAAGLPLGVWDDWSRLDPARYHEGECASKWAGFSTGGEASVGPGSIVALARAHGWEPEPGGVDRPFGWDDEVEVDATADGAPAIRDADDGSPWDPVGELSEYLAAVFRPEEHVGYVMTSDERGRPQGKGVYARTAAEIGADLDREAARPRPDVAKALGDWDPRNGAWIRVNPLDGDGVRNSDVTAYRHVLVESDSMDPGEQYAFLRDSMLPIAAMVSSAGKSVHAVVRVDAPTRAEYRRRVEFLFKWLRARGFEVDAQNRNESRLTRMPGVTRAGRRQMLLGTNLGLPTWEAWEEWAIGEDDGLPDMESLSGVWGDMPPLSEPLIDGVLRRGHKMLLAGPSKAGKSYALIELAIAIAEGASWLGWPCRRGRVLYVNLELDRASCFRRFADVYRAAGIEPANVGSIDVWNLRGHAAPMAKIAPRLIHRAAKRGYDLIIIDPIYKVVEGDENSAGDMARFCNSFDEIATSLGCAVAYCHHHSKGLQGQKASMDRASGSGVFARDPDALLDMSPLDVPEEDREAWIPGAIRDLCMGEIEAHMPWILNRDELAKKAPADLVGIVSDMLATDGQRRALEARVESVRMATPWRVEGTLREFPAFPPRDMWFVHPLHVADTGSLRRASVLGDYERLSRAARTERATQARRERVRRANGERVAAIAEGIECCAEDGVEPTRENVLARMPEVDGKAPSMGSLKRWTIKSQAPWSPYSVRDGLIVKEEG